MLGSLTVKQPRGQRLQKRQIALNPFRLIGQKKAHFFGVVKKESRERKAKSPKLRWEMEKYAHFKNVLCLPRSRKLAHFIFT